MQHQEKPLIRVLNGGVGVSIEPPVAQDTLAIPAAPSLGVNLLVPPPTAPVLPGIGPRRGSSSGGIINSLLNPPARRSSQPRRSFIEYAIAGHEKHLKDTGQVEKLTPQNNVPTNGRNSLLVPQGASFIQIPEGKESGEGRGSRRNSAAGKNGDNPRSSISAILADKSPTNEVHRRQSLLQKIKKVTPELNYSGEQTGKPLNIVNEKNNHAKSTFAPPHEAIQASVQDGNLNQRRKSPMLQQYKDGAQMMKKEVLKKQVEVHKLSNHVPPVEKVKSEGSNASTDLPFENTRFISNSKTNGGAGAHTSKITETSMQSTQLGFYRQESEQDTEKKGAAKSGTKTDLKKQGKKVSDKLTPYAKDKQMLNDEENSNSQKLALSKSEKVTPMNSGGAGMQGPPQNEPFQSFRGGAEAHQSPTKKFSSNKVFPISSAQEPSSSISPFYPQPATQNPPASPNLMPQFALMRNNMPSFKQMENNVELKSVQTVSISNIASMRRNTIILNNPLAPNFQPPRSSFSQANMSIPKEEKNKDESSFEEDSLEDSDDSFSSHDINATHPFSSSQSSDSDNNQGEEDSFKKKYLDHQPGNEEQVTQRLKVPKPKQRDHYDEISAAKNFIMRSNTRQRLLDESSDESSRGASAQKTPNQNLDRPDAGPRKTYTLNPNQDGWRVDLRSVIGGGNANNQDSVETPGFNGSNNGGKETTRSNNIQGFLSQAFSNLTRMNRPSEEDGTNLVTAGQFTTTGNLETKHPLADDNDSDTNSLKTGKSVKKQELIKRSNDIVRESTLRKQQDEALYDDYYQKEGYRLRDIYPEVNRKFIFLPDDPGKTKWEILVSLILIFTAVTTPYRIAFVDKDSTFWVVLNYLIDAIFLIDILMCFVTGYEDDNEELVHDRRKIAAAYMQSWFFIDIISIIPLSEFLETSDFASLARIARLPKLYRLIRMFKLMRLLKVIKERNTISKYLNEVLKLSVALERLVFFCFMFMILVHITSCFWVILSSFEDTDDNLIMRNHFYNLDSDELYVACFYYTTVIVTTIGYGDITVRTPYEQLFCLILLIIGVVGFSFAIGSLSSVLSSLDAKAGKLKEKLSMLEDIRREYKIPYDLYRRLRLALNYDHHSKNAEEYIQFLNELPAALKVELSVVMHSELVKSIQFFRHKPPHFIAYIAPLLKPVKLEKDQYIYKEDDPIDEIYFLVSGQAGYALPDYDNAVYLIVDTGYYFGEIDFIVLDENGENTGKRCFAVRSIIESDLLILSKNNLLDLDMEFEDVISQIFQNAMNRLKRTQWLKKKSIKFYERIRKKKLREEQKNAANNIFGEKPKKDAHDAHTDQPIRRSFSMAEGGSEFLESLQKRLAAVKSQDKSHMIGGPSNQGKDGHLHEDMMKNLDEGDLDKFINEQSSRSSMTDSNSFRSDNLAGSTLRQSSNLNLNQNGMNPSDSFGIGMMPKANPTPTPYSKQGKVFQRQDSSHSSSNVSKKKKKPGMPPLQKKLTMGVSNSIMSAVDEHTEHDNHSRYDDRQYQSVHTPIDMDEQYSNQKTPKNVQQQIRHHLQLAQIENFDFYEEEKMSNAPDSVRSSQHLNQKMSTPINNHHSNGGGSHAKLSGFGSSHKQPKQHSPLMHGHQSDIKEDEFGESDDGGLRWNHLKHDLTKKAGKGRATTKAISTIEALGQFQVKILNQVKQNGVQKNPV